MKLLREEIEDVAVEVLEETVNGVASKAYYLSGIHMQAEQLNKNGRIYPRDILEAEVARFGSSIQAKRALGELGHPDTPSINLDKVSHLITDLHFEGNDVYGRSKLLDTPNGRIAKTFAQEGISIGMSSRALGSLKEVGGHNVVQSDLRLATIDIVHEPSAPKAFVNAIFENREWVLIDGVWQEQQLHEARKQLTKANRKDIETIALKIFESFLNSRNV